MDVVVDGVYAYPYPIRVGQNETLMNVKAK
jgi:hypothetical protein